jgi:hypothetical protein
MKSAKITIIITIILSIILFFIGLYTYDSFITLTLPSIENVQYIATDIADAFKQPLYFGLTLALFPIVITFLWRVTPILTINKKLLTICILLVFMILFIIVRREMIKSQTSHLLPVTLNVEKLKVAYPLSSINFELFAISGLITGSFVSFFSLRQKSKSTSPKAL